LGPPQLAWIEFQIYGEARGGATYQKALEAYKTFDNYNENSIGVKTDWVFTYMEWAQALAIQGKCPQAEDKRSEYKRWISAVVFENDKKRLQDEGNDLNHYLENCQSTPQPQPETASQR
jgi:hypothetical protein